MALTKKALMYLLLAYVFIGTALLVKQPALLAFVIPIALIFFYSSVFSPLRGLNLAIKRRLSPPRSFGGEGIKVTLEVSNNLDNEIKDLRIEDGVPESLQLENGTSSFALSLNPHESTECFYEISAPKRGRYHLGPLRATSMDSLGLRQHSETIAGQDSVMIFPRVEDLGKVELSARRVGPWPGTIPSRSVGHGTEFFELRLYTPGDELRRINWKASARHTRLVTNAFETERVTDVLVVLDCSDVIQSGIFTFDAEEFEVNLAASLCSQLLLQGNRVGLSIYGAERTWVPPAFGKRQLLRILSALTITKAGRPIIPIDFAVETITKAILPVRSVVVFITPLVGDEIVEGIRSVAASAYGVISLIPSMEPPAIDESPAKILARRILATERRVNMRQIAPFSTYVQVSPRTSIKILSRRGIRRNLA